MKNNQYIVRRTVYSRTILLLLTLSIIALPVAFFSTAASVYIGVYMVVGVVLIITLVLLYIFPLQDIKLVKQERATIRFERRGFGQIRDSKTVKLAFCWWNYTDIYTSEYMPGTYQEANPNHPKNTGTGNMDSSGIPTEITLYIKLVDESDVPIVLYQQKGNWASIPNWKYDLAKSTDFENAFECNGLEKLLVWAIVDEPLTNK